MEGGAAVGRGGRERAAVPVSLMQQCDLWDKRGVGCGAGPGAGVPSASEPPVPVCRCAAHHLLWTLHSISTTLYCGA